MTEICSPATEKNTTQYDYYYQECRDLLRYTILKLSMVTEPEGKPISSLVVINRENAGEEGLYNTRCKTLTEHIINSN